MLLQVPSLSSCRIAEDELHPHALTKSMPSSTALCDIGNSTSESSEERMCCSDCVNSQDITAPTSFLQFPIDVCSPSDTIECVDFVTVRNLLLRLCASGASPDDCCMFLRQKRGGLGWEYFKHCVCHNETACDVALFLDLAGTFASCGAPLEGIPSC